MKPVKVLAKVGMIAMLALNLTACGKKKNGSAPVATTPSASVCTQQANGTWVMSGTNTPCTNPNTPICPSNGQYQDPTTGQMRACVPGQPVSQLPPPGNGGGNYGNGFPYGGCSQYEYQYGIPYIPVYMHQYGQYMCVRYDLVYGYAQYPQYDQYGYDYYYSYPPYTGNNCNNQVNFGGQWGYVGLCF